MSFTRQSIRQRIGGAEFCGDGIASTASAQGGAAGATLIDTTLLHPNDFFNAGQIVINSGTASGDIRYVSDWVQSTGTFTPDRAFTAQIAAAVTYEVHSVFTVTEKNKAIEGAIYAAGIRYPRRVENTTLTFATGTYTYDLSSLTVGLDPDLGLDMVLYATGATGTGVPYAILDDDLWEVRQNGTTYTLQVQDVPRNGATIRLVYRARPAIPSTDTAAIAPDSTAFFNYLCSKATAILMRNRALVEPESDYTRKADYYEQQAEGFFNADKPQAHPGKVRFPIVTASDSDELPVYFGL